MSYTDRAIRMHVRNQFPGIERPEDTNAYRILTEAARESLGEFVFNKCPGGPSLKDCLIEGIRRHYTFAYDHKLGGCEHIAEYSFEQLLDITQCYILTDRLSDGAEILDMLDI